MGIEILLSTGFPFNVAGFHAGIFSIKRLASLSKGSPREFTTCTCSGFPSVLITNEIVCTPWMESFNASEGYCKLVLKKLYKSEYPLTGSAWTYSDLVGSVLDPSFITGVSEFGFEIFAPAACLTSSSRGVEAGRRSSFDESLVMAGGVC